MESRGSAVRVATFRVRATQIGAISLRDRSKIFKTNFIIGTELVPIKIVNAQIVTRKGFLSWKTNRKMYVLIFLQ